MQIRGGGRYANEKSTVFSARGRAQRAEAHSHPVLAWPEWTPAQLASSDPESRVRVQRGRCSPLRSWWVRVAARWWRQKAELKSPKGKKTSDPDWGPTPESGLGGGAWPSHPHVHAQIFIVRCEGLHVSAPSLLVAFPFLLFLEAVSGGLGVGIPGFGEALGSWR